jgi:glycosyltransferase involved in cell wall biosynthesis
MSKPNITFVIELHDLVKKGTVAQISKLKQNRVILAPISPSIQKDLERHKLPFKIVFSPMGVDLAQFENREAGHLKIGHPLKIGYFGKLAPSGYSKGYEDLLELAAFHQAIDFPSIIQLVGAADSEIEYLRQYAQRLKIKSGRFEFESHKRHQETISLMHNCDILVLTTPASTRYHGSPIKAIEYAATGKPILAAKSVVNEDVFNGHVSPYWYTPGDVTNMHEVVLEIMNDPNRELIAERMRDFAESRTWRVRTERILNLVVKNRKGL